MKLFHWLIIGALALVLASCGGTPIPAKPNVAAKPISSNLNGTTATAKRNGIRGNAKGITTLMGFGRLFKAGAPLTQMLSQVLPQLTQTQVMAATKSIGLAKGNMQLQAASGCLSGTISSPISRSTDADGDGIPVEVLVLFSNCVLDLGATPNPVLNGAIYIKDGNDASATSSYTVIIDLTISNGADSIKLGLGVDYSAPATIGGAHGFNFVIQLKSTTAGVVSEVGVAFNSTFQPTTGTDPFGNGTLNFTGTYAETAGADSYSFNLTGTNLGIATSCDDFNAGTLRVADADSFFQVNYTSCGHGTYTGDTTGTF